MISKRLEMLFTNTAGRRVTVAVTDPKEDLTTQEVNDAMAAIISANVFDSPGGDLIAVQGARVVTREIAELVVVD